MRYGKFLTENTTDAEDIMATSDGGEYTDAVLRADGWFPIIEVGEPSDSPNRIFRYTLVEDEDGGHIEERYIVVRQPRTFSKFKLVMALMKRNLWTQVKAFIEEAGLMDLYQAAQSFDEDNDYFKQAKGTLQSMLGVPDEIVEQILSESIV